MEDAEGPGNKRKKTEFCHSGCKEKATNIQFLRGCHVQILEAGIGKVRSELFRKKIIEFGGTLCSSISGRPSVLVVDDNMTVDRLCRLLKVEETEHLGSVTTVRSLWLSDSIKNRKLISTENYQLPSVSPTLFAKVNLTSLLFVSSG